LQAARLFACKPRTPPWTATAAVVCLQTTKAAVCQRLLVPKIWLLGLYRGMFEFGAVARRGKASPAACRAVIWPPVAAVLFFVRVNQVLVRLWARVTQGRSFDRAGGPVVPPYV
jgi:hypothetical protein